MSQFIESICHKDGAYQLLEYHQARMNRTFENKFPNSDPHVLTSILPQIDSPDKTKVRVLYNKSNCSISTETYQAKKISTLGIVRSDLNYSFKSADRTELTNLLSSTDADEIIIIKNGLVTDSSYSNLCFWDGQKWITSSSYLLNGVKRQSLLDQGLIIEKKINQSDLRQYEKTCLINAMLDLGEMEIFQ